MAENTRSKRHSDIGTFVVRVMQHQNGTWQGKLTWVDEDKSVNFRSVWEMVRLMEEGLLSSGGFKEEDIPAWE